MWLNLLFFAALLLGLTWLLFQKLAELKRANSFNLRSNLPFDEWYDRFYGAKSVLEKQNVQQILFALGDAFDIEGTRLLPTDRLDEELSIHHPLLLDDSWDSLDALLVHTFRKRLRWNKDWKTVDDAIRGFCEQLCPGATNLPEKSLEP